MSSASESGNGLKKTLIETGADSAESPVLARNPAEFCTAFQQFPDMD
jgi:hypothetical protein